MKLRIAPVVAGLLSILTATCGQLHAQQSDPTTNFHAPLAQWQVQNAPVAGTRQVELLQELYDRVLALEGDRQNRALIERARAVEAARRGIDVTDEKWIHTWGGRIMGDWVNWANDSQFGGQPNYFEFRQLRLFASGEGYGVYDYTLEFEFAPGTGLRADVERDPADPTDPGHVELNGYGVALRDVFLGIHDIPRLGYVRFGHFKVPFSLSELTSARFITFMERSLPNVFTPGREVGVTAYNHSAGENVTWAYGAFFDELDTAAHRIEDDNQGVRLAGRLTWTPRYDELAQGRYLVHTGIGYIYTRDQDRSVRFRARPEIHVGDRLIDTDDIAADEYHTLGGELAWVHGRLSLQSELMWTSINQIGPGSTDLYGAYVYASYFLTGEHRPYDRRSGAFDRVIPYENFWIVNTPRGRSAGWGAWEVAARWSYLDFSDVAWQQLNDLTVGLNWYWNPHARMMLNWIHPFARHTPASTAAGAEGDVIAMRFQVDF